jgi:drug/metabolite transporter (DMT)-like permease
MSIRTAPLFVLETGLVLAWSSGFIGGRLAADTASIFLVLFWRFAIVSVLLAAPLLRHAQRGLSLRSVGTQAVLGGFAMFGYLALGIKAIDLGVPAGTAALISALQPLAAAALVGPLLGERVHIRQWIGLALGLLGVAVAVGGTLGQVPLWAAGLSLLSMASLVVATLFAKAVPDPTPALPALGLQGLVAALLFAPLAMAEGGLSPELEPDFAFAVGWFVVLSTFGGYGLYWICLRRTTVTRVGSLIYLTPPVTMVWAWLMFGDPLEAGALAGLALCLFGVALTLDRKPAAPAAGRASPTI